MKTTKILFLFFLISNSSLAQCYSKIVSYSRNYIALQTDGTLWSKGTTFNRRLLGFGDVPAPTEFTQIGTESNWTKNISITSTNVFAIKTDGTLWVWGTNSPSTGLGSDEYIPYITPTQIGTESNWATVSSGISFTIATKTDGTLWAWGSNAKGQLGIGSADDLYSSNVPIQVGNETNWAKVFASSVNFGYALKTNGTLWSWGNEGNYIGYLDASANNNYRSPHQVGADNWLEVAISISSNCMTQAVKTDGSLWAWGRSANVQYFFGNGVDSYASITPVRIGNDNDWKEVHLGQATVIALKTNGTRWGWGRNSNLYELGMGTIGNITVPTQLDSNTDWKTLDIDIYASGGNGIKENNALYHWGYDHLNTETPIPTLFSPNTCTLSVDGFNEISFTSFPNPFDDYLHIKLNENNNGNAEIGLVNQLGQKLLSQNLKIVQPEFLLDLSNYASGIYILSLKINGQIYKTKIIKN